MATPLPNHKPVGQAKNSKVLEFLAKIHPVSKVDTAWKASLRCVIISPSTDGRTRTLIEEFCLLIQDFGAKPPVLNALTRSLEEYLSGISELDFWSRAKKLLCFFKAKFLKEREPDVTGYNFSGHWKRWALSRMKAGVKNTSLWGTVFKLKNAAKRLSPFVAFVQSYQHSLKTAMPFDEDTLEITAAIDTIEPLLLRAARHLQADYERGFTAPPTTSLNACVERKRCEGGQLGELCSLVFGPGTEFSVPEILMGERPEPPFCNYDDYLSYMRYEELQSWGVLQYTFWSELIIDGVVYRECYATTMHMDKLETFWLTKIKAKADKKALGEIRAKVVAILEPFKVRIITTGQVSLQYTSTFFQKSMLEFNRKVPAFRLVGKAPTTLDIEDLLHDLDGRLPGEKVWGSRDFSGATDGTASFLSSELLRRLVRFLPDDEVAILTACNGPHTVTYPVHIVRSDEAGTVPIEYEPYLHLLETEEVEPGLWKPVVEFGGRDDLGAPVWNIKFKILPIKQRLGTLMGEKTSFIILCYEVLVAHISALRRCGDARSLKVLLLEVLINGDDSACVTNAVIEENFWAFCAKYLGFTESVGKSYKHKTYVNINSQSYLCPIVAGGHCTKVPIRAVGLEAGKKKIAGDVFDPTTVIREILAGCYNPAMQWTVLQRFLVRHTVAIRKNTSGRNLFVAVSLGGCGNPLPAHHGRARCRSSQNVVCHHGRGLHWDARLTDLQREVATDILLQPDAHAAVFGPLPRPERARQPEASREPWDVIGQPTAWDLIKAIESDTDADALAFFYRHKNVRQHRGNLVSDMTILSTRRRFLQEPPVLEPAPGHHRFVCGVCGDNGWVSFARTNHHTQCKLGFEVPIVRHEGARVAIGKGTGQCLTCESKYIRGDSVYLGDYVPQILVEGIDLRKNSIGFCGIAAEARALFRRYRVEGDFPRQRFSGRSVDLWGSNPHWQELHPVSFTVPTRCNGPKGAEPVVHQGRLQPVRLEPLSRFDFKVDEDMLTLSTEILRV